MGALQSKVLVLSVVSPFQEGQKPGGKTSYIPSSKQIT